MTQKKSKQIPQRHRETSRVRQHVNVLTTNVGGGCRLCQETKINVHKFPCEKVAYPICVQYLPRSMFKEYTINLSINCRHRLFQVVLDVELGLSSPLFVTSA